MTTAFNPLDLVQDINTEELIDFTDIKTGGGRGLLPVGDAYAVLTGYIELGNQKQRPYKGKPKPPAPEVQYIFTIVGGYGVNKEGNIEQYVEAGEKLVYDRLFPTTISGGDNSRCQKYFQALLRNSGLRDTSGIKSASQLLGQLYTIPVGIYEKDGKEYNTFVVEHASKAVDQRKRPLTEYYPSDDDDAEPIPFAELGAEDYKLFYFRKPTSWTNEQYMSTWDSLFIDGEWEAREVDGVKKPAQSKNKLQEAILNATDFLGSSIDIALGGNANLPSLEIEGEGEAPSVPVVTPELPDAPDVDVPDLDDDLPL